MSIQWYHCSECGWSTTFLPEFNTHMRQRHGAESVPKIVETGLAREGFDWGNFFLKFVLVVLAIVAIVLASKGYLGPG